VAPKQSPLTGADPDYERAWPEYVKEAAEHMFGLAGRMTGPHPSVSTCLVTPYSEGAVVGGRG